MKRLRHYQVNQAIKYIRKDGDYEEWGEKFMESEKAMFT